jgi:hypothetical protein
MVHRIAKLVVTSWLMFITCSATQSSSIDTKLASQRGFTRSRWQTVARWFETFY